MARLASFGALLVALTAAAAATPPGAAAKGDSPPAVVELLEDPPADFPQFLVYNDGGSSASREFRDYYSGVCSVAVTPLQRYNPRLPGWNYPVAEKPGPGQYRYLRFAWKRVGGDGIMIQLHNAAGSWNQRYLAGQRHPWTNGWGPMLQIAPQAPAEWTVVTRDLFKDFGPMTLTGLALTPMPGGSAGLFDHFYLGRTVADLDRASAAAFGNEPLPGPLARARLGELWRDLASPDVAIAGRAVRTLVAGRKDSVTFVAGRLTAGPPTPGEKRIRQLMADLDDNRFRVREEATKQLEDLGDAPAPLLRAAVKDSPSLEVRRRAGMLLARLAVPEAGLTADELRQLRAVRVLEWSATAEARQALAALSRGAPASNLADQARRALERLRKGP